MTFYLQSIYDGVERTRMEAWKDAYVGKKSGHLHLRSFLYIFLQSVSQIYIYSHLFTFLNYVWNLHLQSFIYIFFQIYIYSHLFTFLN